MIVERWSKAPCSNSVLTIGNARAMSPAAAGTMTKPTMRRTERSVALNASQSWCAACSASEGRLACAEAGPKSAIGSRASRVAEGSRGGLGRGGPEERHGRVEEPVGEVERRDRALADHHGERGERGVDEDARLIDRRAHHPGPKEPHDPLRAGMAPAPAETETQPDRRRQL